MTVSCRDWTSNHLDVTYIDCYYQVTRTIDYFGTFSGFLLSLEFKTL